MFLEKLYQSQFSLPGYRVCLFSALPAVQAWWQNWNERGASSSFKVVPGSVLIVVQNMNKREIYLQVGNVQFRHVTYFVVLYPAPEA